MLVELKRRLKVFAGLLFAIILIGTLGFHLLEGLSITDAFYFSIVTMATVGYGDIHPATIMGKLLSIFVIVGGVGTFLSVVASASDLLLNRREQQLRKQKMNMVIGLFFSEIVTRLLRHFSEFDPQLEEIRKGLIVTTAWSEADFSSAMDRLRGYGYRIDIHGGRLDALHEFLKSKGDFLVRLLENPLLLDHEFFTDLLMAIFHLREELMSRSELIRLPSADQVHLAGDIKRAYDLLVIHWIEYMKYLNVVYPYLFSHAMRTNPFDPNASPIVS